MLTVYVDGKEAQTIGSMGVNADSRIFALEPLCEGTHFIAVRVFNQMGEAMLTKPGTDIEICSRSSLLIREIGYYSIGLISPFPSGPKSPYGISYPNISMSRRRTVLFCFVTSSVIRDAVMLSSKETSRLCPIHSPLETSCPSRSSRHARIP